MPIPALMDVRIQHSSKGAWHSLINKDVQLPVRSLNMLDRRLDTGFARDI